MADLVYDAIPAEEKYILFGTNHSQTKYNIFFCFKSLNDV